MSRSEYAEETPSLRQLYDRHTGKVSDKWSLYLDEYDRNFAAFRRAPVRLLEIGVQNGGSLEIWSKFFPKFRTIVGCDIDKRTAELHFADSKIHLIIGDSNTDDTLIKVVSKSPKYDIIIDDGSHEASNIIGNFLRYFPLLEDNGVYAVEDLHCSYWSSHNGGLLHPHGPIEFFKKLVDIIHLEYWRRLDDLNDFMCSMLPSGCCITEDMIYTIRAIRFIDSLCFIEKCAEGERGLGNRIVVGAAALVDPAPTFLSLSKEQERAPKKCTGGISDRITAYTGDAQGESEETSVSLSKAPIRIAVFSESSEFASTRIRIDSPLRALPYLFSLEHYYSNAETLPEADVYIIQRHPVSSHLYEQLIKAQALGKKIVFDLDDLLTDLPAENPHRTYFVQLRPLLMEQMKKSDMLVVSTETLRQALHSVNENIQVFPNYLDPGLFVASKREHVRQTDKVRILLAGTPTHSMDFKLIESALSALIRDRGDSLEFVQFGVDLPIDWSASQVRKLPFYKDYYEYVKILKDLEIDLALVPLAENPANRCKSNIKWLEFSACGIPGIYSDIEPYHNIENWLTGVRVPNTSQAWYDAIRILMDQVSLRRRIGENALQEMQQNWDLPSHLHIFASFYRNLVNQRLEVKNRHLQVSKQLEKATQQAEPVWLSSARELPREWDWAREKVGVQDISLTFLLLPRMDSENQSSLQSMERQWVAADIQVVAPGESWMGAVLAVVEGRKTDWFALLDGGDRLSQDAVFRIQEAIATHPEWQLIYTDEDSLTADGQHVSPHCKPDFNIDYLRSLPYVGGLLVIKRELFLKLGGFDPAAEGAEDYDLVLRAWERVGDAAIGHIPQVLYHRLQGGGHCRMSVEEILAASKAALERHLERLHIDGEVLPGPFPPATRVRYPLTSTPVVSIVIPTRNQLPMLQRCVESIIEKTRYPCYEILIVDNDSDEPEAVKYLELLIAQEESFGGRLRVLRHPGAFNFSAMNNRAVAVACGDYILLLNNDTAVLHEDWLDEMVSQVLRPEVGIVGAKLLFPDGRIQHAGVILGMRGPAEHPFIGHPAEYRGYFGRAMLTQNLSAVTGACLLISKALYQAVGGLDEHDFRVSYNDVDLCLKVREQGKKVVFTPWAILLHEGSASQRGEVEKKPNPEKEKRFADEKMAFYRKWLPQLAFDPAYNRQLSLASTDFLLEDQAALTWDPAWRPRPRILVHPADREGCGEYRIIAPMRALQRAGRVQGWETMRIFEPAEMERFSPESIVVQRQMEWPQIEALERHKALSKVFRVFEIDDLITNLPVKSLHKTHIHKDIAKRFRKAAGLCNRLVVATEPLAEAYRGFSDELRVQPNCIEDAIWGDLSPKRRGEHKPRVGWAGGIGHTGDLELVADVVRELSKEVHWVFFGLCPDALKPYVQEFHSGVPLAQYPAKLASLDLDLAIAPLEDNPFNEAKSHLRLLEYGILGYPVVCSDIFPYQGDYPVWRVANRYRDWVKTIRELLADREALALAGDALRRHVREHWLLESRLDDWLRAWLP